MTRRRDLGWAAAAIILIVALWLLAGPSVSAGRGPDPTCWWEGTTLRAENLPPEWSLTREPHPIGVVTRPPTFEHDFGATFTAYFWTRGGPYTALFKPGPQKNDYKPVCIAEVT